MARLLARLVVIALLPSLFGCDGKTDQQAESTAPFEGVEIQIAVPAGMGFDSRLQSVIAEWEARTNGTAKLVEYELHPGQAVAVPSGSVLSIVPLNTVSHRIVEGQSVVAQYDAIPASQQSDAWLQWHDVFKGLRENVGSAGGQASIVPLSCDTLVCVFRQDLLSKAKLEPPRTWDEYDRLVQQLDQWAPSLVAAEPWSDDFRVTMFLARSVSYARHPDNYSVFFDIRSGRPLIDSPGFQIGLAESVAAIKRLPKACLTMSPSDCVREVVEGRAAIAIGIPSLEPASADSAKRDAKQDHVVGSCRLPGSRRVFNHSTSGWEELPRGQVNHVPLVGFSGFAAVVENTATHTQAAAARNMLRTISIEGAPLPREAVGLVRKSQMNRIANLLAASETRLHPQEIQLYLNAVSESLNDTRLVTEIPVAGADRFKLSLREMLDQAIGDESVSVPEQLDQQVKAWTSLVSEVGQEVVRRSYRFSLGMR
ncbi:MAG: hypothetical protein O3A00_03190 [Planctomycetota bacterium]|nr:hypothetical protein [Planctomycetota bacterium]